MMKFKKGEYFMYKFTSTSGYWLVGRIIGKYDIEQADPERPTLKYYEYEVVKRSGYFSTDSTEKVGSKSQFGAGSIFHDRCTKLDSADDSYILAKLL